MLENIEPKEWTEEEMLLVEDMHIAEETEWLKQNLMREDEIEDGDKNSDDNITDKQNDELVIQISVTKQLSLKCRDKKLQGPRRWNNSYHPLNN